MMDKLYEKVSLEFVPVSILQAALLRSAMPANDYLIHGNKNERQQFQILRQEVDTGFNIVSNLTFSDPQNNTRVANAQILWLDAVKTSNEILSIDNACLYH